MYGVRLSFKTRAHVQLFSSISFFQFQTDNDRPVVGEECADSRQRDVSDLDILVGPLVEQLDAANLLGDVLGQDGVALGLLDFDFSGVRHVGDVMGGRKGRVWRGREVASSEVRGELQILSDRVWAFATPGDFPSAGLGILERPTIAQSLTSPRSRDHSHVSALSLPSFSYPLCPITLDRVLLLIVVDVCL